MSTITNGQTEYSFTVDNGGVALHVKGEILTVDASDLRDHCGDGDCPGCSWCDGSGNLPTGAEALKRWHDDQGHHGPLWLCYEEPCKSVAEGIGAWGMPA